MLLLNIGQRYFGLNNITANTNITIQTRTANTYNISDSGLVGFWALNNDQQ